MNQRKTKSRMAPHYEVKLFAKPVEKRLALAKAISQEGILAVAKKSKADAAASGKVRKAKVGGRSTSSQNKKSSAPKKLVGKIRAKTAPVAAKMFDLTNDQISMRAYFISERRRRLALPGDANSDWLEAKRQLLAEVRH